MLYFLKKCRVTEIKMSLTLSMQGVKKVALLKELRNFTLFSSPFLENMVALR